MFGLMTTGSNKTRPVDIQLTNISHTRVHAHVCKCNWNSNRSRFLLETSAGFKGEGTVQ